MDVVHVAIQKEDKCGGPDGNFNLSHNVDVSQLPHCQKALHHHIRRTDIPPPRVPQATDVYEWTTTDGKFLPMRFKGN